MTHTRYWFHHCRGAVCLPSFFASRRRDRTDLRKMLTLVITTTAHQTVTWYICQWYSRFVLKCSAIDLLYLTSFALLRTWLNYPKQMLTSSVIPKQVNFMYAWKLTDYAIRDSHQVVYGLELKDKNQNNGSRQ